MIVLRRFVTVPLVIALMVGVLVSGPLVLTVAGLVGLATRSSRPVRTVALAMAYAAIELRTLMKLAIGNRDCDRLMGDFLTTAHAAVRRILDVEVVLDPSSTTNVVPPSTAVPTPGRTADPEPDARHRRRRPGGGRNHLNGVPAHRHLGRIADNDVNGSALNAWGNAPRRRSTSTPTKGCESRAQRGDRCRTR
jgi:hypothetical protein